MRYGKTALLSKKSRKSEGNARKVESISFTLVQRCVNMTKAFHMVIVYAPVAQGIEHRPPEAGAAVRIRPGVYFFYYFLSPCVHNELSVAGLVWRESYESKDS